MRGAPLRPWSITATMRLHRAGQKEDVMGGTTAGRRGRLARSVAFGAAIALIICVPGPFTLDAAAPTKGNPSTLRKTGAIEGIAVDSKGRQVSGALVAAVPENLGITAEDTRAPAFAHTGRDGRFRLGPVPAGPYGVTATRTGLAAAFVGGLSVGTAKTVTGVKLRFGSNGSTFRGHVRDNHGAPVPGAQIRALRYSDFLGDVFYANADSSGAYEITLPQATYLVLVVGEGFDSETRNARAGQDRTLDFQLDPRSPPGPAPEAVVDWIRSNAIPLSTVEAGHGFSDMERLRAVVGKARLVSLGEATHGTREFFQLKHRMLEFLVARMGFTVFGIEATMPEGFDVNDYVLTGRGDPARALSGLYFWTWDTKEVLDLIRWMRAWNADPAHQRKVKFYGFDMQSAPRAVKRTVEYLHKVDPAEAARMDETLAPIANPYVSQRLRRLPAPRRAAIDSTIALLLNRFDERRAEYARRSSPGAWALARQHARIVSQWLALMGPDGASVRDRAMAENIQWILQHEGPDAKMVVWAHNGHVSAAEPGPAANGMGSYLRAALGQDMVVFGFSFNRGSFQAIAGPSAMGGGLRSFEVGPAPVGSLDQTLAQAGLKTAAVDLRRLPDKGPVAEWFSRRHGTRSIGAVFIDSLAGQYYASIAVPRHFDAILFVDTTTTARRNERGRRPPGAIRAKPSNLDFEQGASGEIPPDWTGPLGSAGDHYRAEMTKDAPASGARCARIRSVPGRAYGEWFGNLSQTVEVASYQGKHVRLRASVRVAPAAAGAAGASAYLWLRASGAGFGPGAELLYDGMENQPIVSGGWREYSLEGDVPKGALSISYGLALVGEGTAWLDAVSLETAGKGLGSSPP